MEMSYSLRLCYWMLRIPMNCNYQVIISDNLPAFYEEILSSFNELPARYNSDPFGKSFSSRTKKSKRRKGFLEKKKTSPKDRPWTFSTLMKTLHRCTVMPTHGYDLHRKTLSLSLVLFPNILWLDCIPPGRGAQKPNCHNLLLPRDDLPQKSFS